MKRLLFSALLLAVLGCTKPKAEVWADGGTKAEGQKAAVGWTDAKVREYLRYQRALNELMGPVALPDGGFGPPVARSDDELGRHEAGLRKVSGLTDAEFIILGQATGALFTRRMMMNLNEMSAMHKELVRARSEVPDGSVPEVDAALEVEAERNKRLSAYAAERARFGDALIDVLIPHEQELLVNWTTMLNSAGDYAETREHRR